MNELALATENGYRLAVGPLKGLSPTQGKAAQESRDAPGAATGRLPP